MHYSSQTTNHSSLASEAIPKVWISSRPTDSASSLEEEPKPPLMLCCYQNHTPKIQVIRSVHQQQIPHWHLERVVFPGQRLLFEAPVHSKLQVYTSQSAGTLLDDTVSCDHIQVQEK
jgi:hypothetical protein